MTVKINPYKSCVIPVIDPIPMSSTLLLKITSEASLRGMVYNGMQQYAVYDFINIACEKNHNSSYGNTTFFRLTADGSKFKKELLALCKNLKFPGQGQRETPTMTLRGLQRLLFILGGKVAEEFRKVVEGVFTRVMAGDTTLIEEIVSNRASNAPIHKAFRQALEEEPVLDGAGSKRKMDQEDVLFELEVQERRVRIKQNEMACVEKFSDLMTSLNPTWKSDSRLRMQVEDALKTTVISSKAAQIANGAGVPLTQSISVSQVAQEEGIHLKLADLVAIGKAVAKSYKDKYGEVPGKHSQWVDGAERKVNSYTERDRDIIKEAIEAHMAP